MANMWEDNIWDTGHPGYLLTHELEDSDSIFEDSNPLSTAFQNLDDSNPNLLRDIVGGKYNESARTNTKDFSKKIVERARKWYDKQRKFYTDAFQEPGTDYDKDILSKIDFKDPKASMLQHMDGKPGRGGSGSESEKVERLAKSKDFESFMESYNPFVKSALNNTLEWDDSKGLMFQSSDGGLKPLSGAKFSTAGIGPGELFGIKNYDWRAHADKDDDDALILTKTSSGREIPQYAFKPTSQDYLDYQYDAGGGLTGMFSKLGKGIKNILAPRDKTPVKKRTTPVYKKPKPKNTYKHTPQRLYGRDKVMDDIFNTGGQVIKSGESNVIKSGDSNEPYNPIDFVKQFFNK